MSRELRRSKNHTFTLCSKNELGSHRSELKSVSNICLVRRHFQCERTADKQKACRYWRNFVSQLTIKRQR